jgi:hypothetical protein
MNYASWAVVVVLITVMWHQLPVTAAGNINSVTR